MCIAGAVRRFCRNKFGRIVFDEQLRVLLVLRLICGEDDCLTVSSAARYFSSKGVGGGDGSMCTCFTEDAANQRHRI